MVREKRNEHLMLAVDGEEIVLRDQAPLYEGKMRLDGGYTFGDFVECLNSRVFFWPGTSDGPNDYGKRHFARYSAENPLIIRVPTIDLVSTKDDVLPLFCRYNSGSPRPSNGVHPPRGPKTFVSAAEADFRTTMVVEITFENSAKLPTTVQVTDLASWSWRGIDCLDTFGS